MPADILDPNERAFQQWFAGQARRNMQAPNPDDPRHRYDWRGAYAAGAVPSIDPGDGLPHWPSAFKYADHPNRFVEGRDTRADGYSRAGDFYNRTQGMSPGMPMLPQLGPGVTPPGARSPGQSNLRSQLQVDDPSTPGNAMETLAKLWAEWRLGKLLSMGQDPTETPFAAGSMGGAGGPWGAFDPVSKVRRYPKGHMFGRFGPLEEGYDVLTPNPGTAGGRVQVTQAATRPGGKLEPIPEQYRFGKDDRTATVPEVVGEAKDKLMQSEPPVGTRVRATATGKGPVAEAQYHAQGPEKAFQTPWDWPEQFRGSAPNNPDAIALLAKMLDSLGLRRSQLLGQPGPQNPGSGALGHKLGESGYRWRTWKNRGDFDQP